jgi:hypothetical protein
MANWLPHAALKNITRKMAIGQLKYEENPKYI